MAAYWQSARDGDIIRVNGQTGELTSAGRRGGTCRSSASYSDLMSRVGTGRELFGALREKLSGAEQGNLYHF